MHKHDVANLMNDFAFDLYEQIRKSINHHDNLIFSPASVWASLAMLYHGARGNTAHEIMKAMKVNDYEAFHDVFCKTWQGILKAQGGDVTSLTLSNRLWVQKDITVKKEFSRTLNDNYKSDIGTVDFLNDKSACVKTINKWIEGLTHGKMADVIKDDSIPLDTRLLIINVISFTGKWEYPFSDDETTKMPFHCSDGSVVDVDMMYQKSLFSYVYDPEFDCEALIARYKKSTMRLLVIMPKKVDGLDALEKRILQREEEDDCLFNWMQPRRQDIKLYLPKLTFSHKADLVEPLQGLGVRELFTSGADLSGISDGEIAVSKLSQQAFIQIDEEGTICTAVTESNIVAAGPGPNTFKADHPFMMMLVDNDTGMVMFWARYCKP